MLFFFLLFFRICSTLQKGFEHTYLNFYMTVHEYLQKAEIDFH